VASCLQKLPAIVRILHRLCVFIFLSYFHYCLFFNAAIRQLDGTFHGQQHDPAWKCIHPKNKPIKTLKITENNEKNFWITRKSCKCQEKIAMPFVLEKNVRPPRSSDIHTWTGELCPSRNVGGNTLQQVEIFKYFGVMFPADRRRNKEINARICKANAVLRELYRAVVTKRKLSNIEKLSAFKSVFVPILTYLEHESWVITEKVLYLKYKWQGWDFCEEFTVRRFEIKCTTVKFVKLWMSSHFSETRRPSYDYSYTWPECPRKDCRSESCWTRASDP